MKNWIKENLVLVVGLTLPLLLIVLFFVATVIPKAFGTPPQYEMLFTSMRYDYQKQPEYALDFSVKNRQLMVTAKKGDEKNPVYNSKSLFIYDGKTESVREVAVDIAKTADGMSGQPVLLEETKTWVVDNATISPDGYALEGPNYHSGGLVGGLFGFNDYNTFRLKKGSVGYKVPNGQPNYYYSQPQFIGWVIKK
jgi:hypothetical protein